MSLISQTLSQIVPVESNMQNARKARAVRKVKITEFMLGRTVSTLKRSVYALFPEDRRETIDQDIQILINEGVLEKAGHGCIKRRVRS